MPVARPVSRLGLLLLAACLAGGPALAQPPRPSAGQGQAAGDFGRFVAGLWPEAQAAGVSRATFDAALRGVTPDPKIVALTRKQSEFVRPIWDYVNGSVSAARLAKGAELAARWSATLDRVERQYGVPRSAILAIWGMETGFGANTGNLSVVRSLATLAFVRYRGDFFRGELVTALRLLEEGAVEPGTLRGSWAGAMGQTQFMPSSYAKFSADGDGDGRRDIWGSVPDALASTANFLRQHGWQPGLPWGVEVELPEGFDFQNLRHDFGRWASLGVQAANGRALPGSGEATLFLPAGAGGPAFLITANYDAIKSYNSSDAYALGVALLGDRLVGGRGLRAAWPVDEPQLDGPGRMEVQRRLTALGLYEGDADGRLGSKTRAAVRAFQLARGLPADGYASPALLQALRQGR